MELLAVVVTGGIFDLDFNLSDSILNIGVFASASNDRRVLFFNFN